MLLEVKVKFSYTSVQQLFMDSLDTSIEKKKMRKNLLITLIVYLN